MVDWVHVCEVETGSDCLTVALSASKLVGGGDVVVLQPMYGGEGEESTVDGGDVVVLQPMYGGEGEESTVDGGDVTIDRPVLELWADSSLPLLVSMVPAEAMLLGVLEEVGGVAGEEWSIIG